MSLSGTMREDRIREIAVLSPLAHGKQSGAVPAVEAQQSGELSILVHVPQRMAVP